MGLYKGLHISIHSPTITNFPRFEISLSSLFCCLLLCDATTDRYYDSNCANMPCEQRNFQLVKREFEQAMSSENIVSVVQQFLQSYRSKTPTKLKLVDAYLAYILLTGIIQFVYCALVGTFPFNSFLSGFISCVGSFVLGGKRNKSIKFSVTVYFSLPSVSPCSDQPAESLPVSPHLSREGVCRLSLRSRGPTSSGDQLHWINTLQNGCMWTFASISELPKIMKFT